MADCAPGLPNQRFSHTLRLSVSPQTFTSFNFYWSNRVKSFRFDRLIATGLLAALQVSAQNVATTWNSMTARTMVQSGDKDFVAPGVWFAYVSLAVYDAVNAVHLPRGLPLLRGAE